MIMEYALLGGFYILSAWLLLALCYMAYQRKPFSFHLLFSVIYFVTFYLGFPLSLTLFLGFNVELQSADSLLLTLFSALSGYLIYYAIYHSSLLSRVDTRQQAVEFPQKFAKFEAKVTAYLLAGVAIASLVAFIAINGLLLFKLTQYNQIFSAAVSGVALKRFFYFFIPALLIMFFLSNNKKAWVTFLICGVAFGVLTYLAVGGTRANMALAFVLFFFIGLYKRYLSFKWLVIAGVAMIGAMFVLALVRYGLNVSGKEALFTFLYLTRDTFSPWENVALILDQPMEHQGLMPIVRDFYVYIPKWLWLDRPDYVLNTANYFTWEILGNFSGLAISPTLLGSFYIMGGFPMIALGMAFIGLLIKAFDRLLDYGRTHSQASRAALIQAYCFANLFNIIVLVREGSDAFFSRLSFFSVIFALCWLIAYLVSTLANNITRIKEG
ncbi:ECA oligosaccharide polymerase [Actinobacillus equuli]|uniref:ECA oligosaccharide polymerase n=1 Tax=Actinobacillus equuli TaxID=718 RepID=UPI0024465DFB|nr:ECA oligosaccharide polymerase [Actinobacillus equuli]WGE50566.1 ECA oligosaccharide polymerase [Actinobacillus equuli subsp. haemolyticus]WGE83087.1 ECA oligosaccharide polymerase [Actinobacillus equuli subsp. equuli]